MKLSGYVILVLLTLAADMRGQEKYMVFFKDKGYGTRDIKQIPFADSIIGRTLSARAILRREKTFGPDNIFEYGDLPVCEEYVKAVEAEGVKLRYRLKWLNAASAECSSVQAARIAGLPCCLKVEKIAAMKTETRNLLSNNRKYYFSGEIDNTAVKNWYQQLAICDIPRVHELGIKGEGVLIGMLDSGFDWKTPAALNTRKVIAEYDFINKDSITSNQTGDLPEQDAHGTFVFSLIGGLKDSIMVGAAHQADFVLAKTENEMSETHAEEDYYAAALEWMDSLGVDITSSSIGYNTFDYGQKSYTYYDMNGNTTIVTRALNEAFKRGILTFTSAGNEGGNSWNYIIAPADAYNVLAIGALKPDGSTADFSSRGPTADGRIKPDLMALGVGVFGVASKAADVYYTDNGTSSAVPVAAGAGALLLSAYPFLTNVQARWILINTAKKNASPNNASGYGIISALNALTYPVIENTNANIKIHKYVHENGIVSGGSRLHIISADDRQYDYPGEETGQNRFVFNLSWNHLFKAITFYFTHTLANGAVLKEPVEGYYYTSNMRDIYCTAGSGEVDRLDQNFPNPFSSSTVITFRAAGPINYSLEIFDILGRKVQTIKSGTSAAGINLAEWDGSNARGEKLSSGVYFCSLNIGQKLFVKKMLLLR